MFTELELVALGFKCVNNYKHDQYNTNEYVKGILEIEFTYEGDLLVNVDVKIVEVDWLSLDLNEVKQLDNILNK